MQQKVPAMPRFAPSRAIRINLGTCTRFEHV